MLITDQKTLVKLVLSLRVDIDFLLKSIEADPSSIDEMSRSQFLEGLFHFLKEATDLTGDTVRSHLLFSDTPLATPARPDSVPLPSLSRDHTRLRRSQSMNFVSTPVSRTGFVPYAQPYFDVNRYTFLPIAERHSLWFPNAPPTATPERLEEQIFGGPLESLRRYKYAFDEGSGYLINFFNHETAAAFLAYSNSSISQISFPGTEADWRPRITWSENPNTIRRYIIEAVEDLAHPARRGIVISGFPAESVSKAELRKRLEALDRQYTVGLVVHIYEVIPAENLVYLLFEQVRNAIKVMEWCQVGLLGPELDDSTFLYERDPSERPFPEVAEVEEVIDNLMPLSKVSHNSLSFQPTVPDIPLSDHLSTALPIDLPEGNKLVDVPDWISHIPQSLSVGSSVGRATGVLSQGSPPQSSSIASINPPFDPYWDTAVTDVPGWNSPPLHLPTPPPPPPPPPPRTLPVAYSTDILVDINTASIPPSIASSIDLLLDIVDTPRFSQDTSSTGTLSDAPDQISPPPFRNISVISAINPATNIPDWVSISQPQSPTTTPSVVSMTSSKPSFEGLPGYPTKTHHLHSPVLIEAGNFSDSFFSTDWDKS